MWGCAAGGSGPWRTSSEDAHSPPKKKNEKNSKRPPLRGVYGTRLVKDRQRTGFCETHKDMSVQHTRYAMRGTHVSRVGDVQAGVYGVALTQEAHTAALAVAVAEAEAGFVFKGRNRCFAKVASGGRCRKSRAAKNDVCSHCKGFGRTADSAFKTDHSA
jgi:hypothetical protein